MPAFLSKLKKKILNEVDDAKDFSTKKALGGFDFVRDIATRPDYKAGGSKAFEYMNALSDMGTGAATYRFADPVKDQNGNLRADFSWKSFGRGFTSPFGNQNKWENEFEKQGRDDNSFRSAFSLTKAGGKYWDESNLPTGAKVAGDFALDPSMYIPAGTIGRLSAKAGLAGTRFGRVALGGATKYDDAGRAIGKVGASSRSARIAGGFLEGAGRNTLGMSAGAGLLSEGAAHTPWEGDDYLSSLAGGIIGGTTQGLLKNRSLNKQISRSMIDDTEFERRMGELRKQSMSDDPDIARAAEDAMNALGEAKSKGMIQPSKKIARGPKLDEMSDEEFNKTGPDSIRKMRDDQEKQMPGAARPDDNEYLDELDRVEEQANSATINWVRETIRRGQNLYAYVLDDEIVVYAKDPTADPSTANQEYITWINKDHPLFNVYRMVIGDDLFEAYRHPKGAELKLVAQNYTKEEAGKTIAKLHETMAEDAPYLKDDKTFGYLKYIEEVDARRAQEGGTGFFGPYSSVVDNAKQNPEYSKHLAEGLKKNEEAMKALSAGDKNKALQLFAESNAALKRASELIDKFKSSSNVKSVIGDRPLKDILPGDSSKDPATLNLPTEEVTFKTEKGSTYTFDGETSVRNKAQRAEHGNDYGIKDRSEKTVFFKSMPQNSDEITEWLKTGNYETSPREGLYPFEYWEKSYHVGNKITEVSTKGASGDPRKAPSPYFPATRSENAGIDRAIEQGRVPLEENIQARAAQALENTGQTYRDPREVPLGQPRQINESPSFRITDKLRQRYTSAAPVEPIQNIPTEEMPTLKTHLQELIWGMDEQTGQERAAVRIAGGKKAVGETAREKFTLNQFEKPKTPPIGDYRLRAEELLNELSDEELNMPVANLEVADLIASIVGGRDMEKILSQRALEAKAYRESTSQLPATIMRDQAPPVGMGGTVANSNKVPYQQISDPNTEIAAIEQIQDQLVLGGSGTPPTPGAPTISFLDPDEQIASLRYLAMPRRLSEAVEDVKTWTKDNVVVKALTPIMGLVNPSVLLNTKVGRVITARTRQELAVNELSTNALSVFDRFNGRLGIHPAIGKRGTVFSTNDNGIVKDLNMHWNDIFADVENLKDKLTPQQYEYAKTFNDIIDDVRILRTVNLLPNLPRDINGKIWVPRTVKGIDNIEIIKPTNHRAKRYWELATDGANEGVDYADPRETLKLYLRETYNEIIKADFAHEMQKITESTDTLVNPIVKKNLELATAKMNSAKTDLKFAAQQWRADKNNPDLTKIYEDMKQKAKDAYIEQLKAKTGMEKALEAVKAQESNRSYRILEDGTKEPIDTYKINKIGERVVSREDAKLLRNYIGVNGMGLGLKEISESPVSKFFGVVGRTFRTTTSTLDAATPFIHTLPVLSVRPKAWAKAMAANYIATVSPRWRDSYATKNLKYINEMANYNIAVGSNEYFEAIGGQGDITKALNKTLGENSIPRKILRGSGRQTVGRMEAAMSTNLLVARTELWKALREDYAKDNNLAGLAQFVRNITGALDSRALMVGKGQRDQESFWLAFSPKLVRSTFALGAMALNPTTKEGWQAARALTVFLGGVLGTAYLVNLAFNPDLDPLSEEALSPIDPRDGKKFMASKTPIGYIGIGGQIRAAMQLFGKSADALWRREPGVFLSNDQFDNPIMSWYMGRGAPGIQFGQDVIEATTGANANPYTEITSPSDFFKTEAVNFLPFFAQNILEAEDMKSGALAAGIGSFGPRFAPFSPTEVRNHRIEAMGFMTSDGEVAKELDDLNREQKKEFFEKFPVEKITKEDNVTKMFNQIDQEEISYNSDIALMSLNVQRGTMSKVQFREWLNERTSEKYAKIDQIKSTFSVLPADRAGFEGSVTEYISSKNTRPEDRAVSDYYEASSKVPLKPNGEVDYDGIKAAKQRVLDSLTPEQRQYVTKMVTPVAQREENELVTEYDIVKEITQPYFQSDERIFEYFRRSSGFFSQFNSYEAYQSFIDQTAAESGITPDTLMGFMSKTVPDIELFDTLRTEYKRIQRLQDPNLDRALTEWYGMEPANRYDYLLSGMGSDAGAALSPAIAADKSINNGNAAAAFALKLRSSGDYKPVKRKFYRPQRSL